MCISTSAFGNSLWLNSISEQMNPNGFIYSSVQSPNNLNIALSVQTIDSDSLILSELIEMQFQRMDSNIKGLPTYKEIGNRKKGLIDMNKKLIEWI